MANQCKNNDYQSFVRDNIYFYHSSKYLICFIALTKHYFKPTIGYYSFSFKYYRGRSLLWQIINSRAYFKRFPLGGTYNFNQWRGVRR